MYQLSGETPKSFNKRSLWGFLLPTINLFSIIPILCYIEICLLNKLTIESKIMKGYHGKKMHKGKSKSNNNMYGDGDKSYGMGGYSMDMKGATSEKSYYRPMDKYYPGMEMGYPPGYSHNPHGKGMKY
jgi:hypothetical protein